MKQKIAGIILVLFTSLLLLTLTPESKAQGDGPPMVFIVDAETEHALRTYALPIFKAAGLPPENVNFFIIQDDSINAFVAEGMNIFVHTGLIKESEDPMLMVGVLAHETGHIAGGHLVRRNETYEKAVLGTALSYVLGAASIAAGSGDAGAAIITGGQHVANRSILAHSRIQEQSADQAALTFLERAQISARGLLGLLEKLGNRETLFYGDVDPYTLTHPLSQDRVSHIRDYLISSPFADKKAPPEWVEMQERLVAKLRGFLDDPDKTLATYPESDKSLKARYARAIAYHKKSDLPNSLKEMDSLLAERPEDAYFNELKGQILFENGKILDSLGYYRKAMEIIPESAVIKIELATAIIASEDKKMMPEAIGILEKALVRKPQDATAWHQLGIAYGKNGELGPSYLALAEEATLQGKKDEAVEFTKLAEKNLSEHDPAMLRARDIRKFLENKYKKEKLF